VRHGLGDRSRHAIHLERLRAGAARSSTSSIMTGCARLGAASGEAERIEGSVGAQISRRAYSPVRRGDDDRDLKQVR
jgi:hypothetical protein